MGHKTPAQEHSPYVTEQAHTPGLCPICQGCLRLRGENALKAWTGAGLIALMTDCSCQQLPGGRGLLKCKQRQSKHGREQGRVCRNRHMRAKQCEALGNVRPKPLPQAGVDFSVLLLLPLCKALQALRTGKEPRAGQTQTPDGKTLSAAKLKATPL
eukprot:2846-Pelagomonas_calceolata.AAC.1